MTQGKSGMTKLGMTIAALGLSLVGCAGPGNTTESVPAEANSLGIVDIEIDHDVQNGDRVMTVTGLDADGQEIGNATVRTGTVSFTSDPDLFAAEEYYGRELNISVGRDHYQVTNPSLVMDEVTQTFHESTDLFIHLHSVAEALTTEQFRVRAAKVTAHEVAFATPTTCPQAWFPIRTVDGADGSSSSCCRDDATGGYVVHNTPSGQITVRKNSYEYYGWTGCTDTSGNHNCTGSACAYGPAGMRKEAGYPFGTSAAVVYRPDAHTDQCGRDYNGSIDDIYPYTSNPSDSPYTGTQYVWPNVTASSPYNDCISGTPVTKYSVSVSSSGSGSGYAYGNYPSGGGSTIYSSSGGTWEFATAPTITAVPSWSGARAYIYIPCYAAGSPGQTVSCTASTLDPTASVYVMFQ